METSWAARRLMANPARNSASLMAACILKTLRMYSRPGNDLTYRFPLIVEAVAKLRSRSCIIDGEAVACGDDGIVSFNRIRYRRHDAGVFLYAFDQIELDGDDLRRDPLAVRKATLSSLLRRAAPGLRLLRRGVVPLIFLHPLPPGSRPCPPPPGRQHAHGRARP
jgi:hypothetical protein